MWYGKQFKDFDMSVFPDKLEHYSMGGFAAYGSSLVLN